MSDSQLSARLERTLEEFVSTWSNFPGVALAVRGRELCWSGAAGLADIDARAPLQVDAPFRIASVTKTFTAAAILRLVENGLLELDDSIAGHVKPATNEVLRNGGYDLEAIRIEDLLRHTSGLVDYAEHPEFRARVVANPQHRWTRAEQVRFATEHGTPLSEPGKAYHYSDTGYVLLGEIVEQRTGEGLATAYRSLLAFKQIGIVDTHLETLEAAPPGLPRAHQYLGRVDSTAFDPSFDLYGGGGLVSTVGDLARFYGALFEGRIFDSPSTLTLMLTRAPPAEGGLGISSLSLGKEQGWGEAGFWGVAVMHFATTNLTIASTVNQANDFTAPTLTLHADVLRLVASRRKRSCLPDPGR